MSTPPDSLGVNDPNVITGFTPTYSAVVGPEGPRGISGTPGTGMGIVLPDAVIAFHHAGADASAALALLPPRVFTYDSDSGLIYDQDGSIYGNGWALAGLIVGALPDYPYELPPDDVVGPLWFRRFGKIVEFHGWLEVYDPAFTNTGTPMFQLPENFRPEVDAHFAGVTQSPGATPPTEGAYNLLPHPCMVKIDTDGNCSYYTDSDPLSPPTSDDLLGGSRLVMGFDGWAFPVAGA